MWSMLYDVICSWILLPRSSKSCDLSCDYAIKLWLMWQCDQSILTLVVLKIENRKINRKENKNGNKNKISQVHFLRS